MIVGGLCGIILGFLDRSGLLIISALNSTFAFIPLNELITGLLLGVILGGLTGDFIEFISTQGKASQNDGITLSKNTTYKDIDTETLQLKEEQLNIAKTWMKTGDVKTHRETVTVEKTFTVPIQREELVIEKQTFNSSTGKPQDTSAEIIRIPLNEERVDFTKHRVALEDVSIHRENIKEIKHFEETLRKEKPKVKITGSPKVTDKSHSKRS
ncbi:YsnF/AvaK domain-containing protein [Clostridium sp. YIM B02505]|uniref:YsnF/AvaK domain-containing protein n=2 Tax=Clostridium yunnanense TaxID=2800325 RepID=A0ABS1ERD7_9CLOT|nr:YsnF/AvaK domain-containing protein [Clostridium yunnanense]